MKAQKRETILEKAVQLNHKALLDLAKKVNDHSNAIEELKYPKDRPQPAAEQEQPAKNMILRAGTTRPLSMANVEVLVCQTKGHLIMAIDRQVPNTELADPTKAFHKTTVTKQEIFCVQCGMTLDEIRGSK